MAIKIKKQEDLKKTEFDSLKNPPKELSDELDLSIDDENRFKKRKITLSDDKKSELSLQLRKMVQDWRDSRSILVDKLRDWNDQYEGVVTISDFPWPGASNIDIPITKVKAREISSVIKRNTMRPSPFLMSNYVGPDADYKQNIDLVKEYEWFLEDKLKNETNIHNTLKQSLPVIFRDGTAVIQILWETDWEMVSDFKIYDGLKDGLTEFIDDYPKAEDAGISSEKYSGIIRRLESGGKYELKYEYEAKVYDAPKAFLVPLIDFFFWPVYVPNIEDCLGVGKRVWYTDYQLEKMYRDGKISESDWEYFKSASGDIHDDDNSLTQSRDEIEGINRSSTAKSNEFEFFEIVYRTYIDDIDKKENLRRKYVCLFHEKSGRLVRVEEYPIRKGKLNYFLLKYIERDGRLLGVSLTDDISDLALEINIQHRQRINSRTITHVPSFKAKSTAKSSFDPSDKRYQFRPGVTFWLNDLNDVAQFDIRPVDLSGSVDDEMLLLQFVDMVTGSTSGFSGQSNPIDPRAPARKQQELLRQSANRIDDYVDNISPTFANVGTFVMDLYYQYGEDTIKYYVSQENGVVLEKEMARSKLFNPKALFRTNATSVFMSPDQEYARFQEVYQVLAQSPITMQNARIQKEALKRLLDSGRVRDDKNLIPTDQELGIVSTNIDGVNIVPSEQEKEALIDSEMQAQKTAARLRDGEFRRQNAIDLEIIRQGANNNAPQTS